MAPAVFLLALKLLISISLVISIITASFMILNGIAIAVEQPQQLQWQKHIYSEGEGKKKEKKTILLLTKLHNNKNWFFNQLDKESSNNKKNNNNNGEGSSNLLQMCPLESQRNCKLTNDKRLLRRADAVVVHPRDSFDCRDVSRMSRLNDQQRLVFFSFESPVHTYAGEYPKGVIPPSIYADFRQCRDAFNWTMTYRNDSDIPIGYGTFFHQSIKTPSPPPTTTLINNFKQNIEEDFLRKKNMWWKKKSKSIAWVVSNCETASKREQFASELGKFIDIDIFGACGTKKCSCKERASSDNNGLEICHDCYRYIEENYFFYLAFENSLCNQYVTEKLYQPLSRPTGFIVPIVLSAEINSVDSSSSLSSTSTNRQMSTTNATPTAVVDLSFHRFPNYQSMAPPHSVVDSSDFGNSPERLGNYLKSLMISPDRYNRYFDWRQSYQVEDTFTNLQWQMKGFCQLCQRLNNPNEPTKYYNDIHQWWFGDNGDNLPTGNNEEQPNRQCAHQV